MEQLTNKNLTLKKALEDLEKEIFEVEEFTKAHANAHKPIKEGIKAIRLAFLKTVKAIDGINVSPKISVGHASTQTVEATKEIAKAAPTPRQKEEVPKRTAPISKGVNGVTARPQEGWTTVGAAGKKKKKTKPDSQTKEKEVTKGDDKVSTARIRKAPEPGPTIKPKNRHPKAGRVPADTIILKKADGEGAASYAEILRSVHASTKNKKLDVKAVRKTQRGELIFRMGRKADGAEADALQAIITEAAGPLAKIHRVVQSRDVEIRDLDEGVTPEEVIEALKENKISTSSAKLRPAHSGTQACMIKLPCTPETDALLRNGRIKIGLVRCRIRESVKVRRCYRCMGYGHFAAKCKAPDRSKLCLRCGQDGHKIANCTNAPKCPLCTDSDNGGQRRQQTPAAHTSGSRRCPKFRAEWERCLKNATK